MTYLMNFATRRLQRGQPAPGVRIDEQNLLNLPGHHGDAFIRVFVENTYGRLWRTPPQPQIRLEIADCVNEINLEFEVNTAECRTNALHKVDTLIDTLTRFRAALVAEGELYELRAARRRPQPAEACQTS
jgi:hypothetical protein